MTTRGLFWTLLVVFGKSTYATVQPLYSQQIYADHEDFAIGILQPCTDSQDAEPTNICDVEHLTNRLLIARHEITTLINTLPRNIRNRCSTPPADVRTGGSLEETYHTAYELLTNIALNLTIITSHPFSIIESDVTSSVKKSLCNLHKLLELASSSEEVSIQATLRLSPQTMEDMELFTCVTLKRARSGLRQLKHVIENDVMNKPTLNAIILNE